MITEACRKSAKETYGISKGNKKRHADKELEEMSIQQKKLKLQAESSTKKEERRKDPKRKKHGTEKHQSKSQSSGIYKIRR